MNENSTKIFESIVPLTIGAVYFLEVTTIQSASCEYTITVLEGDTRIPDVVTPDLDIDLTPCLGETVTHQVTDTNLFTTYVYTLNGDTISNGPAIVDVTYDIPGAYELCVQADNVCSTSELVCRAFVVRDPEPTVVDRDLCPGACFPSGAGEDICAAGEYPVMLFDQQGCDSLVIYRVTAREISEVAITASVCQGDSLWFNGQFYRETGAYPIVLSNRFGCDSIVTLHISEVFCPVLGTIAGLDPVCFGAPAGTVDFSLTSGVPPFVYSVERLGEEIVATGTLPDFGVQAAITELLAGTYLVTVTDNVGSVGYLNVTLFDPEPLSVEVTETSPTCYGETDGSVRLNVAGGQSPYTYAWEGTDQQSEILENRFAGPYRVSIADAFGCTRMIEGILSEPPRFTLDYSVTDEACASPGSGSVQLNNLVAGDRVQVSNLTGSEVVTPDNYESLSAGCYQIAATNQSGCPLVDTFCVVRPEAPDYRLSVADNLVELGETTSLRIESSSASWRWLNAAVASESLSAPTVEISPLRTTVYPVEVTAPSGCTVTDSLTVIVDRSEKIYTPTAFSPNGDGVNDRFRPFVGRSVDQVLTLSVYDRWGGAMYTETPDGPAEELRGWDGLVNERRAPPGVYTWQITARLVDGENINLNGITNLIR